MKIEKARGIWGSDAKNFPSAHKLEKFWVLEKKFRDSAQTGWISMEYGIFSAAGA